MEGMAEFAGNLKAELLDVREGLRLGQLTQAEALQRVGTVRQRRIAGMDNPPPRMGAPRQQAHLQFEQTRLQA